MNEHGSESLSQSLYRSGPRRTRLVIWIVAISFCVGLVGIVLLVAFAAIMFVRANREAENRLSEQMSLAEASSEPLTPQQLEGYYSIDAGVPDTTYIWLDAAIAFQGD